MTGLVQIADFRPDTDIRGQENNCKLCGDDALAAGATLMQKVAYQSSITKRNCSCSKAFSAVMSRELDHPVVSIASDETTISGWGVTVFTLATASQYSVLAARSW